MIDLTKEDLQTLWAIFKESGSDAITWNHYDLAEKTSINDPEMWKAFLMTPEVSAWIDQEIQIIQKSEIKKIVKDSAKSRSVGQAQLMNSLVKLNENSVQKEGPVFIYMHVPLNEQQIHAPNAFSLDHNPFRKEIID